MSAPEMSGWDSDDESEEFFDANEEFDDADSDCDVATEVFVAQTKDATVNVKYETCIDLNFSRHSLQNGAHSQGRGLKAGDIPSSVFSSAPPHAEYPLHGAAYNNQLGLMRELLATLSADAAQKLDIHGNNALHIAAFQEHQEAVQLLLDNGFRALSKSSRGWTALDEAVSVRNEDLAMLLAKAETQEMKDEIKSKQKLLLQTLLELPDYSLQLKWELGSSVPGLSMLLRKYLPHDTYSIWKKGQLLRVDGTLMGIDTKGSTLIPEWKRGHFSVLFDGSREKAQLFFVNRGKNTYVDVQAEKRKSKDELGGEGGEDAFVEERVRAMLSRTTVERPKLRAGEVKFKPCKGWLGGDLTERVEGWSTKIYDATAKIMRMSRAKTAFRLPPSTTFAQYLATQFEEDPTASVNPLAGLLDDSSGGGGGGGAAAAQQEEKGGGGGGGGKNGSKAGKVKRLKISGRCWMAEGFPMSLRQLLPLLDVVGTANKHIAKVCSFMNKYGDLDMFPVRVQVSLWLSVYALLSFKGFKTLPESDASSSEDFFRLPKGARLVSLQEILEQQAAKMEALAAEQEKLEGEGIEFDDSDLDLFSVGAGGGADRDLKARY